MTPAEPIATPPAAGCAAVGATAFAAGPAALQRPAAGAVHVWTLALHASNARVEQAMACLAPDECAQVARLRSFEARAALALRREALRQILAGYLSMAAQDLQFTRNAFGKPQLQLQPHSQPPTGATTLSFNTSHSGDLAVVAIAGSGVIGIDIEQERPWPDALAMATRFFSAAEAAELRSLPAARQQRGFLNAWTRKEAVVKAAGKGLSMPLDAFEVSLRPGAPPAVLHGQAPEAEGRCWQLHHLEPAAGCIGALATDFVPIHIGIRHWPEWSNKVCCAGLARVW